MDSENERELSTLKKKSPADLPQPEDNDPLTLRSICLPKRFRKKATLCQKLGAEVIATFILVFAGAGAGIVNELTKGTATPLGISTANGLVVMMMIYSTGHISGAHMNPAVTLAFATVRHFPWSQVPLYVGAQVTASVSASFVLRQLFTEVGSIGETIPAANFSVPQALIVETLISFILMFVVSAVSTDTRAIGELAGLAVGATVALNNIIAGPLTGASMNPARSIGPAIAGNRYTDIWIYMLGPVLGTLAGAWSYNLIRTVGGERSLSNTRSFSSSRSFNKRDSVVSSMV